MPTNKRMPKTKIAHFAKRYFYPIFTSTNIAYVFIHKMYLQVAESWLDLEQHVQSMHAEKLGENNPAKSLMMYL